ncbi:virulence RhuM family protein [Anaerovibrio slackiae]|uniref:virulence RhuM family protein n=1 Tax=Anaerovibrio slackiae TaxID=2652309 RepID=UPI00386DD819
MNKSEQSNFILYSTEDGESQIKLYANNGTVWLSQAQIATLFNTSKQNISKHIKNIFNEGELLIKSVVNEYLTTAPDGKSYKTLYYNLDMILAIGFRVRSNRGTQFRKWANTTLKEYLLKGFILDAERLKNPDGRPDYFDELLAQIRDIRASEKRFYQKLRDLFALSVDYDKTDNATNLFFADMQNKLIYGVTGMTAAELIISRADASKPNMALTSWSGSKIRKVDVVIAKNYLKSDEIDSLNRLVTIFLETAEFRAKQKQTLTMDYWRSTADKLLVSNDVPMLKGHGNISSEAMRSKVHAIYDEFDTKRRHYEALQADNDDLAELDYHLKHLK